MLHLIPAQNSYHSLRNPDNIPCFNTRLDFLIYFLSIDYNGSYIMDPVAIKYITRIGLGLSHLREHKFKHSFQNSINPKCNWGNDVESVIHFFSIVTYIVFESCTLLNSLRKINNKLLDCTDSSLNQTLQFWNSSFTTNENKNIIKLTIDLVLSTKRFDRPLLWTATFVSPLSFKQL